MGLSLNMGMSGLMNGGGGVGSATGQTVQPTFSSSSSPASVSEAAFGPGYGQGDNGAGSLLSALNPLQAFGLTFWSGVIAVGLLLLVRHSLPN